MKITTKEAWTGETQYQIMVEQTDDINATELAMSYQEQYKEMAVISFSRIIQIEHGLIICNLNLNGGSA